MVGPERNGGAQSLANRDHVTKPQREIKIETDSLIARAKEDAFQRIPINTDIQRRVETAIDTILSPYVLEGQIISSQLNSPEYKQHIVETEKFLGAKVGFFVCPDGRILVIQLGDPRYASFYRDLQGFPPVRLSTRGNNNRMVLNNPYISAAILTDTQLMKKTNPNSRPKIIQFVGPHIHSVNTDLSCGAREGLMTNDGHTPEIGMEYGGLFEFWGELGEGFNAFNNVVEGVGGECTTIDLVHDAHSQGFIVGLRNGHDKFDRNLDLRANLELLAKNKIILMTEFLDSARRTRLEDGIKKECETFSESVINEAVKKGITLPINIGNYYNFARNAIDIGEIARNITKEEEETGFSFIPELIKQNKTDVALRALAYHVIRNVVYRTLGGIKPGQHTLQHHPEKLIRTGPVGADFNVANIPFIQNTVPGEFQESDISALVKLYQLSYRVLKEQKINLKNVARTILVTGIYDSKLYADPEKAQAQLNLATHIVQNNAAWTRERFKKSIKTGETVVIGALHEPGTRKLTHIV